MDRGIKWFCRPCPVSHDTRTCFAKQLHTSCSPAVNVTPSFGLINLRARGTFHAASARFKQHIAGRVCQCGFCSFGVASMGKRGRKSRGSANSMQLARIVRNAGSTVRDVRAAISTRGAGTPHTCLFGTKHRNAPSGECRGPRQARRKKKNPKLSLRTRPRELSGGNHGTQIGRAHV